MAAGAPPPPPLFPRPHVDQIPDLAPPAAANTPCNYTCSPPPPRNKMALFQHFTIPAQEAFPCRNPGKMGAVGGGGGGVEGNNYNKRDPSGHGEKKKKRNAEAVTAGDEKLGIIIEKRSGRADDLAGEIGGVVNIDQARSLSLRGLAIGGAAGGLLITRKLNGDSSPCGDDDGLMKPRPTLLTPHHRPPATSPWRPWTAPSSKTSTQNRSETGVHGMPPPDPKNSYDESMGVELASSSRLQVSLARMQVQKSAAAVKGRIGSAMPAPPAVVAAGDLHVQEEEELERSISAATAAADEMKNWKRGSWEMVKPRHVMSVMGQQEFWKARRTILQQQKTLSLQVFELHRVTKVQKLLAATPAAGAHVLHRSPTKPMNHSPCLATTSTSLILPCNNIGTDQHIRPGQLEHPEEELKEVSTSATHIPTRQYGNNNNVVVHRYGRHEQQSYHELGQHLADHDSKGSNDRAAADHDEHKTAHLEYVPMASSCNNNGNLVPPPPPCLLNGSSYRLNLDNNAVQGHQYCDKMAQLQLCLLPSPCYGYICFGPTPCYATSPWPIYTYASVLGNDVNAQRQQAPWSTATMQAHASTVLNPIYFQSWMQGSSSSSSQR